MKLWDGSRFDIQVDIATLKRTDGETILIHGSAALAHRLWGNDFIDCYYLLLIALLFGEGKSIFGCVDRDQRLMNFSHRSVIFTRSLSSFWMPLAQPEHDVETTIASLR